MSFLTDNVQILFAEFESGNSPDIKNIKSYFPSAEISIYTEKNLLNYPYKKNDVRWGNRMNDYWKVKKLLDSKADVAISFDADMKIVSNNVKTIIPLVKKFGVCLPVNPRKLVKVDTEIGADSDYMLDDTFGMGYAVNMSPIAFDTHNNLARKLLSKYCELMLSNPVRGPLAMWRAIYTTGIMPCLLPPQWCVCAEDVGIGNEIILHIGHEKVRKHYER